MMICTVPPVEYPLVLDIFSVSITTAALGGDINVPSIKGGKIKINIPAGTQNGQILRVPERGVPNLRSRRRGGLMCHIYVETPVKLSNEQRELLQQFDAKLTQTKVVVGQGEGVFYGVGDKTRPLVAITLNTKAARRR